VLPKRAVMGIAGSALVLGTLGVVNATASHADGYYRCRPTAPTLTLGYSMYGATYVTGGKLVESAMSPYGDAENCRYVGDEYTTTAYGGTSTTRYDGKHTWWQKNLYICATVPGTCTP
jgi:hypothetical protein